MLLYCIKGSEPEPTQPACSHHLPNGNAVQYENGSCQNLQTTLGNQTIYVYNYDGTSAGSLSVVNGVISAFFRNPSGYKL